MSRRRDLIVPVIAEADAQSHPRVFKDIFGDGSAVILRNFFSQKECQSYIRFSERSRLTSCGYSSSIRVTDRLQVESQRAADSLYQRIRPFVKDCIDLSQDWPRGIQKNYHGWKYYPCGLNESLRFCRYEEGGFFLPHHDGGFDRNEFERSLYTLMVYLNDDFEGGATNFYREDQRHYTPGDPSKIVYTYQPQAGDVIVFHSQIVHDGSLVTKGYKYILRSEVMYSAIVAPEEQKYEPDHDEGVGEFSPDENDTFDLFADDEVDSRIAEAQP